MTTTKTITIKEEAQQLKLVRNEVVELVRILLGS